jgi:hypothetical protein
MGRSVSHGQMPSFAHLRFTRRSLVFSSVCGDALSTTLRIYHASRYTDTKTDYFGSQGCRIEATQER